MGRHPLTRFLYHEHAQDRQPLMLFDVGCSTGVTDRCDSFGGVLQAVGFDPLEEEIERLRLAEKPPRIEYEAAFVGLSAEQQREREVYESRRPPHWCFDADVRGRSSAARARQLSAFDHVREVFNAGTEVRYASRHVSVDESAVQRGVQPDILKIDTDGSDILVLYGAERALRARCLCVFVESMFHGPLGRYTSTFPNIDLFLRDLGFSLYSIDSYRYTRAQLPGPFYYDMLAQTNNGQVDWADCAYIRDLSAPDYARLFDFSVTPERVLAVACLFEQLGLQDCAAELILRHDAALPYPAEQLLDLLVPDYLGPGLTYREYIQRFEADPKALYASRQLRIDPARPAVLSCLAPLDLEHARAHAVWGSTVTAAAEGLRIETAATPWGYAATVPVPPPYDDTVIAAEIQVLEGKIGVTIMGRDEHDLAPEVWIAAADGPVELLLPVGGGAHERSLLVRNGLASATASIALLRHARLLRR